MPRRSNLALLHIAALAMAAAATEPASPAGARMPAVPLPTPVGGITVTITAPAIVITGLPNVTVTAPAIVIAGPNPRPASGH